MKLIVTSIVLVLLLQSIVWSVSGDSDNHDNDPAEDRRVSSAAQVAYESLPPDVEVELVLDHVRNPVAMAFAPDGRWFFTERTTGLVKLVQNDVELGTVFHADGVFGSLFDERGLIGIALDPNFSSNGFVYIYYTAFIVPQIDNRVVRFRMEGNLGVEPVMVLRVPLDSNFVTVHNGGNLHFGPDGKLYLSIGDYGNAGNAQNRNVMPGKIHRFNAGSPLSVPPDNPYIGNPGVTAKSIYAFGLRNPFDFDFDPVSGAIFAGENGVNCDDEVNRILPAHNYGWRTSYPECEDSSPGGPHPSFNTIPPFFAWPNSVAPAGVAFYRGDAIPEWKNDLFVCQWKTGEMHHFKLNAARDAFSSHTIIEGIVCNLDLENGTDGGLYFISNEPFDTAKQFRDIYRITRKASVYASTYSPSSAAPASDEVLTYTMRLVYYGSVGSQFLVTARWPGQTTLLAGSAQTSDGTISELSSVISWSGSVTPNSVLTATFQVQISDQIVEPTLLSSDMRISTTFTEASTHIAWIFVNAQEVLYLPIIR